MAVSKQKLYFHQSKSINYRESVAGSVIQATGTVEFEDGLRTGVLPGGCGVMLYSYAG